MQPLKIITNLIQISQEENQNNLHQGNKMHGRTAEKKKNLQL